MRIEGFVSTWLMGECLLTRGRMPNGGWVILLRSLWIAVVVEAISLGLVNVLDPERTWAFSLREARLQVLERLHWFGTFFLLSYTALYTRFASQFTYLANTYNQIKAAQCRETPSNGKALREWKAGYIEDAVGLHLATHRLFAPVIHSWFQDEKVQQEFHEDDPDSERRLKDLLERILKQHPFLKKRKQEPVPHAVP